MGLNFYGGFYRTPGDGGPVVGHEALAILDAARPPLAWDEDAAEHLGKVGLFFCRSHTHFSVEVTPTFLLGKHQTSWQLAILDAARPPLTWDEGAAEQIRTG